MASFNKRPDTLVFITKMHSWKQLSMKEISNFTQITKAYTSKKVEPYIQNKYFLKYKQDQS